MDNLAIITSIMAAIGAGASVYISLRKAPAEIRFTNADAAGKITEAAASLVEPMRKRLEVLEAELEETCAQVTALEKQVKALQDENELLIDWANRLTHQVQSHGLEPVKMRAAK